MAKKKKMFIVALLFALAAAAVWFFKFRKLTDKFGNTFALTNTTDVNGNKVVAINGSPSGAGMVSLKKFEDGTVGGVNAAGQTWFFDNLNWHTR